NLAIAPDGTTVAFAVNEDGLSRVYLIDTKSGALSPVDLPEPGVLGSLRFPRDRSDVLFLSADTSRSPSDIFSYDLKERTFTRWTRSEVGGLDTSTFAVPELVRYPSTDDVTVPAFYYKPKRKDADVADARTPVLIIWHGGPEGQSRPSFSPLVQHLVNDLGIAVLLPNVRGSDGYGKAYLAMDDGVKREESLADIGATLDWIASQPDLDTDRVAVYGGSYGGYMVLACATFYPERIHAVIDVVGISSLPSFLKNTQAYRRDLRRREYGDERDPVVREVQERISPLNHVDKIRCDLFVQQGKNDPRVPQSEAEQIVHAVRQRHDGDAGAVWYFLALDEGHGFAKKANRDQALFATVLFLREKLLK
nr:S9 family peptidase [Gemmatimonadota bacterium]